MNNKPKKCWICGDVGGREEMNDLNVVAMIKGTERYIFLYADSSGHEAIHR